MCTTLVFLFNLSKRVCEFFVHITAYEIRVSMFSRGSGVYRGGGGGGGGIGPWPLLSLIIIGLFVKGR